MNKEILEQVKKIAEKVENKLQKKALTKEEIEEINLHLDITLAQLGSYKRYFKRLS